VGASGAIDLHEIARPKILDPGRIEGIISAPMFSICANENSAGHAGSPMGSICLGKSAIVAPSFLMPWLGIIVQAEGAAADRIQALDHERRRERPTG
jgi:hypothetical protein